MWFTVKTKNLLIAQNLICTLLYWTLPVSGRDIPYQFWQLDRNIDHRYGEKLGYPDNSNSYVVNDEKEYSEGYNYGNSRFDYEDYPYSYHESYHDYPKHVGNQESSIIGSVIKNVRKGFQNLQQTIARQGDDFSQNNGIVQGFISLPKPVQVGLVAGTLAYGTLCVQYDCIHGLYCVIFPDDDDCDDDDDNGAPGPAPPPPPPPPPQPTTTPQTTIVTGSSTGGSTSDGYTSDPTTITATTTTATTATTDATGPTVFQTEPTKRPNYPTPGPVPK